MRLRVLGPPWGQWSGGLHRGPPEGRGGPLHPRHSPVWFFQSSAACVFRGLSMFGSGDRGWVSGEAVWTPKAPPAPTSACPQDPPASRLWMESRMVRTS